MLGHALPLNDYPGVELLLGGRLTDLQYAERASMFGVRFTPLKCKTLVQICNDPALSFALINETQELTEKIYLLGSNIDSVSI